MSENICRFVPYHSDCHSIHTVNFVFETEHRHQPSLKSVGLYRIHYVCNGKGELHLPGRIVELSEGDIFFTFPDTSFHIEETEDLSYMYISYLGSRASMIMDKLGISPSQFLINKCSEVCDFWKKAVEVSEELVGWMSESVLLYTFSYLGTRLLSGESKAESGVNISYEIKKYIDDNFTNEKLSLELIGNSLSYSPKYISGVFKKNFKLGISDYVTTVRIQHACALVRQGFTSISDLSSQCGYSDPGYFSKVFRQKMGLSPKAYIESKQYNF